MKSVNVIRIDENGKRYNEPVDHNPPVRIATDGSDRFFRGCTLAGILPTVRQLKKFNNRKGLSYVTGP